MNRILVRVDANAEIGWGHLIRCLAVADAWRDLGGRAALVMRRGASNAAVIERARSRGHRCFELPADATPADDCRYLRSVAQTIAADWVVLDGYHFSTEYQSRIRGAGLGLAVFDDTGHLPGYDCDVLINSSPAASEIVYNCDAATRKLLGPGYVPLRTEVRVLRPARAPAGQARRVLVTLGGGDAGELVQKVAAALHSVERSELEVQFVVGPSKANAAAMVDALAQAPDARIEIVSATDDLPARMAWADVAISAAGGTLWELAYLGVPTLAVIRADNQRPIAEALAERGAAISLCDARQALPEVIAQHLQTLLNSPATRAAMSAAGRELIDGRGAMRIAREIRRGQLQFRPAVDDDREVMWHWANEPGVRAQSFIQQSIEWSTHCEWFAAQLGDSDSLLLVVHSPAGDPVGQVRFQRRCDLAVTSVSIDRSFRGQGLGPRLLRRAVGQAFGRWPGVARLEAEIKLSNLASRRAFELAGFRAVGSREHGGVAALVFRREREESI